MSSSQVTGKYLVFVGRGNLIMITDLLVLKGGNSAW